MAIQIEGSSSSHHEGKKTYGETISSKKRPRNRPHEFKNHTIPTNPKFLESQENLYIPYGIKKELDEWQQLSEECRRNTPYD